MYTFGSEYQDQGTIQVTNETAQTVVIYQDVAGVGTMALLRVRPGETQPLVVGCGAAELYALTLEGREVGRRPASDECNLDPWFVR
jgi:hypothetical protein